LLRFRKLKKLRNLNLIQENLRAKSRNVRFQKKIIMMGVVFPTENSGRRDARNVIIASSQSALDVFVAEKTKSPKTWVQTSFAVSKR